MATGESGSSNSSSVLMDKGGSTMSSQQMLCLTEIRRWVENEAEFKGRTDDDFLIMFLRGCEFDVKITKKTLTHYYECRRDIPEWWDNRNTMDENIWSLLQQRATIALIDRDIHQPTVFIAKLSRIGENLGNFDDYHKFGSIVMETIMRRHNCQLNGAIYITDCRDYKWWFTCRCYNPIFVKKFIHSFYYSMPVRMKKVIVINAPPLIVGILNSFKHYLPKDLVGRFFIYGSEWPNISDHLPLELLPEEYGGYAGPMEQHEDAFSEEILALNDYLVADNKYGFK